MPFTQDSIFNFSSMMKYIKENKLNYATFYLTQQGGIYKSSYFNYIIDPLCINLVSLLSRDESSSYSQIDIQGIKNSLSELSSFLSEKENFKFQNLQLVCKISEGSQAALFKYYDKKYNRFYAIRFVEFQNSSDLRKCFKEMLIWIHLLKLNDPQLIRIFRIKLTDSMMQ
jgi:hypothetical protein